VLRIKPLTPETDNAGVGMVNISKQKVSAHLPSILNIKLFCLHAIKERSMNFIKYPLAIALALSLNSSLVFATAANEQIDELEIITVQGDYRQVNVQNSPSSLSVLTQEDLAVRNAQNLEEIVGAVANVNFASGSQRARYYQIRGIGERSQFQEPINASVGLVVDDIDFSGIGSIASTFDIKQIELFRGPQGTRFGATALAGLIYMSSNAPSDEFESALRVSAGNYNSVGAGLVLSGPATDSINYRFSGEHYKSDGFIENTYLGKDDTNNRDETSLRGKLAITASDELTIDLALLYFDFDNGYDAFSLDNNSKTFSDQPGFDQQETTAMSAKFTYSGFKNVEVISILSHANSDLAYGYDEDWAYGEYEWHEDDWDNGIYNPDPCITPTGCLAKVDGYSSTDHYLRDKKNTTAELRFVSQPKASIFAETTSWVAGVYVKQESEDLQRKYTYLASDFTSTFDAKTLAVFAQLNTTLTKTLNLTTGLRVERHSSDYKNSDDIDHSPDDNMIGGKVVLSYQVEENTMVYASVNRGYKAGSVNSSGTLPEHLRSFEPEYLWNYELGYKASFFENSAYVRAAVFYMDRDDIQISSYHVNERQDGSSEFISYWDNAAQGYNQGLELEAAWNISDNLEIYGAVGLLDTEFSDYVYKDGSKENGRDQAHAPNYQFSFGLNYFINEQWQFNLAVDAKDEFYFSDSHDEKSDSVALLHGSVSYLAKQWQVKLWARNILDETYQTRGFYFGNDPRDGYTAKPYYQYGEPAVFGLTLDYDF
jgi:outer membrane receptor protein involved in Fe transport